MKIADEPARNPAGLSPRHRRVLHATSAQMGRVTTMHRLLTVVCAVLALGIASHSVAGAVTSHKRVVIKPGAVRACNVRAIAVANAVKSYTKGNSGRPPGSDATVILLPSVAPYLKSTLYYTISIGKHGVVDVTPARGTPGYSLGTRNYETFKAPGGGNICSTV